MSVFSKIIKTFPKIADKKITVIKPLMRSMTTLSDATTNLFFLEDNAKMR